METPQDLYVKQCHYDRLHHMVRIVYVASLGTVTATHIKILKQSRQALQTPSKGYRSVDLTDVRYLRTLDLFAARLEKQAKLGIPAGIL